ncbi:MAG: prepilin-type N-terminal cleavage/methylation domain-containing protein [Candidatus Omnitrophota bacterium]
MFKRKGFTLLELIIVVIIIGVLAGIAIPQYLNAVERAKLSKATANLSLISSAEKMYCAQNSVYLTSTFDAASVVNDAELDKWSEGLPAAITSDPDWAYNVAVPAANQFLITADRASGTYDTCIVTLDEKNAFIRTNCVQ